MRGIDGHVVSKCQPVVAQEATVGREEERRLEAREDTCSRREERAREATINLGHTSRLELSNGGSRAISTGI
jgi:hypothetical protein